MALLIVQFGHPGPVHVPNGVPAKPPIKIWNPITLKHRRSFVEDEGDYLDDWADTSLKKSMLEFWCEWEPEAVQKALLKNPEPHFTTTKQLSVFAPSPIKAPGCYAAVHNTDPCVFGDEFKYCICSQNGQMTKLTEGSIILFGSCKDNCFRLDTVFVVRTWIKFQDWRCKPSLISDKSYETIALLPVSPKDPKIANARIYFGATPEAPYEGMFSFFPCLPIDDAKCPVGFPRPCIKISNLEKSPNPKKSCTSVIMDNFTRSKRYTEYQDIMVVKSYWQSVANQVTSKGLKLGVRATMPPLLTSTTASIQSLEPDDDNTDKLSKQSC